MSQQQSTNKIDALYVPRVSGQALAYPLAVIGLTAIRVDAMSNEKQHANGISKMISYKELIAIENQKTVPVVGEKKKKLN